MYTYTHNKYTCDIPASAVMKALRVTSLDGIVFPVHLTATTKNIADYNHIPAKERITIDKK